MSEDQVEDQGMSSEDKFFGVKATFGEKGAPVEDVDVEVVDDRPAEDRRPPAKEASKQEVYEDDDDYVELYVYQNSGGSTNTGAGGELKFFQGTYIRS